MKIFLAFLMCSPLWAADYTLDKTTGKALPHYVGEVRQFRGQVFHLSSGKRKAVQEGTQFYLNDSLITEDRSIAKLVLVDDTTMTIGPNSEIKFDEFEFKSKSERRIHSIIRGQLSGMVKNKAEAGDIEVKTANAVMGVRGTRFLVNHRNVNGLDISEFALLTGSVVVTDDKNKTYELGKNDKIVLVRDPNRAEGGMDRRQLDAEEVKYLESEDKAFGPQFNPFLPFFDPKNVGASSGLFVYLSPKKGVAPTTVTKEAAQEGPGSFDNLRKLNDQLKKKKK